MNLEEFFHGFEASYPIYQHLLDEINTLGPAEIRIGKSQIGFYRQRGFAFVWIPARVLKRPCAPLVLSIALKRPYPSAEWKEVVQPRPNRYMHHLEIWKPASLSQEIFACLQEAYQESRMGKIGL